MAVQTTVTVKVGGGEDYTSLESALNTLGADITAYTTGSVTVGNKQWDNIAVHIILDPSGGTDTTKVDIDVAMGWKCDMTHRILISTIDSAWPSSTSSFRPNQSGFYKIAIDDPSFSVFQIRAGALSDGSTTGTGGLVVSGLEIQNTNASSANDVCLEAAHHTAGGSDGDYVWWDSIICYNASSASDSHCINVKGRNNRFQNCYAEANGGDGFLGNNAAYWTGLFNCLAVDCGGVGFNFDDVENNIDIVNCVAFNNTGDDFISTAAAYRTESNNASDDGTHPGTAGQTITGADFVNAGTDYAPASAGDLDQNGVDLVSDTLMSQRIDAIGTTRPTGNTWAIGPLEPISGTTITVPTGPWR